MRAPDDAVRMPIFVWTARDRRADPARHAGVDGRADRAVHRSQLRRVVLRSNRQTWSCGSTSLVPGHPEVYIVILPGMGVVARCCRSSAASPCSATGFVFADDRHRPAELDRVGAPHVHDGAVFLPFFSFMTALIAIPTGIKMFNWLGTLYRGITLTTAMLFAPGHRDVLIGASAASCSPRRRSTSTSRHVLRRRAPALRLSAAVFGVFAATYYWFPKMSGRMLNEPPARSTSGCIIGFNLAFFPMHQLGLSGMPRRSATTAPTRALPEYRPTVGAF